MGGVKADPVRLSFNPQLRVEFHGPTVTSDAGLLLPRELGERLGLSALIERHLTDPRTGRNSQFPLPDLFRQSIYSRLAEDPTFRMLASRGPRESSIALTSTLHWFETEVLAEERSYQGLLRLNTALVQHGAARPLVRRLILDIDSSESPVHARKSRRPTTATSSPSATIRFSSSPNTATAWPPRSSPVTSTVLTRGRRSARPSLTATRPGSRPSSSERTRPLRSPLGTRH